MEDLTGKQLGPYQITGSVGEGGMAAVYKAYHPAMERYVALKILPRHFASDPQFATRFRQEAKVLAQLQHPHILPVFDFGEADSYTYLVMPFIKSGTLADLLPGKPLSFEQIRIIISQIGGALEYAHLHGLVHRDVKPSNVLIDETGHCLLTDFGLTKILEGNEKLTSSGAVLGTPAYMSPEQGLGQMVDRRSDIYSLGVILYEMATGRQPYRAETPMAVMIKHINDPLPPPTRFNPMLPEALEAIILKTLAKNPEDRYQTAGLLVKALEAAPIEPGYMRRDTFIYPEPREAEQMDPVKLVEGPTTSQGAPLAPAPVLRPSRSWSITSARSIVLAIVGLIVIVGIGFYLSQTTSLFEGVPSTEITTATVAEGPAIPATISGTSTSGSEQARAFAEPILQAIAGRPPDFADDFSTNKGWRENGGPQRQTGIMEIRGGVLRLSNVLGQDGAELPDSLIWPSKDFVFQFETRLVSGDRSSQQQLSFHNFSIGNQGYGYDVSIFSHDQLWVFNEFQSQKGLVALATGTDNVHPMGETTQVMVIVRGDQAALYLDGNPVAYYQTSNLDNAGTTIFLCLGYAETTCEFDNVKFWDLQEASPSTAPEVQALTPIGTVGESFSSEQARTFAEPILQAIADRPPDFADDFSTADKGWKATPVLEYRAGEMEIQEGVLRLTGVLGGLRAEAGRWASSSKDFVIQFDARVAGGDDYSRPDVIFRNFEKTAGIQYNYGVVLYPNGYPGWSLVVSKGAQPNELASRFDDISQKGEATQVLVVARGDQIALYLNQKPVAYSRDSDLDRAGSLLFSCWSDKVPAICEFDNVKFWDLQNVPNLP